MNRDPNIDDGSVIVSNYKTKDWTVTTIQVPWDYQHPVSGNREWEYSKNADGSYIFFTRGADRLTGTMDIWTEYFGDITKFRTPFELAKEFWSNFQKNAASFINGNEGIAEKGSSLSLQPDWKQIKKIWFGEAGVNSISCKN